MRQLSSTSNLVLALLAGLGLLASLGTNWFAAPATDPNTTDGPVERAAFQVSHVFSTSAKGQMTGSDALGGGQTVVFVVVAVIVLLAFAVSVPAWRRQAEDLLQFAALAAPVALIIVAVAHPGTGTVPVTVHYGFIVSLLATLLMASAAWQVAHMREKPKARTPARARTAR